MAFIPNTNLSLLTGIPFNNNYEHTRWFDNQPQQFEYFFNRRFATFNDFTYQKPTNSVRVPINYEAVYKCTYVMYQNTNFGNKWFYAFVTHIEYVNPQVTELTLELDLMQTWQFEMNIQQCFVEREHVADDTVGAHTVPEKLEYGEYIITNSTRMEFRSYNYAIGVTEVTGQVRNWQEPGYYAGAPINYWFYITSSLREIADVVNDYSLGGKLDAIICIFAIPSGVNVGTGQIPNYTLPDMRLTGGVRNNKLKCWPYTVCELMGTGNSLELRYEDLRSLVCIGYTGIGANSGAIYTADYGNNIGGYPIEYSVTLTGFPALGFIGDYYQNWIAYNGAAILGNVVKGISAAGTSALSTQPLSGVQNLVNLVTDSAVSVYQAALTPDSYSGTLAACSALLPKGDIAVQGRCKTIKQEYLRILDNYFDRFGYKVNQIKVPELTSRQSWNYVKTIGANISGEFDADTARDIGIRFDEGITLWHVDNIGDYNLPNNIV